MLQNALAPTCHSVITSDLGELTLVRDVEGLRGVYFAHHWYRPNPAAFGVRRDQDFDAAVQQLTEYLAGVRRKFELPVVFRGDALQIAVWELVTQIPYDATTTYVELAAEIGGGTTARQVGAAVGRNPLSIIVPCHRVVGRNGGLTGYAGGLARKQYLLDHERDQVSRSERIPFQGTLTSGLW
jgi:methylated-DNA-[protein]-cysteine S-methyltransferase